MHYNACKLLWMLSTVCSSAKPVQVECVLTEIWKWSGDQSRRPLVLVCEEGHCTFSLFLEWICLIADSYIIEPNLLENYFEFYWVKERNLAMQKIYYILECGLILWRTWYLSRFEKNIFSLYGILKARVWFQLAEVRFKKYYKI